MTEWNEDNIREHLFTEVEVRSRGEWYKQRLVGFDTARRERFIDENKNYWEEMRPIETEFWSEVDSMIARVVCKECGNNLEATLEDREIQVCPCVCTVEEECEHEWGEEKVDGRNGLSYRDCVKCHTRKYGKLRERPKETFHPLTEKIHREIVSIIANHWKKDMIPELRQIVRSEIGQYVAQSRTTMGSSGLDHIQEFPLVRKEEE